MTSISYPVFQKKYSLGFCKSKLLICESPVTVAKKYVIVCASLLGVRVKHAAWY
jgi:hypothetical protein